jgi:hypothetical protein
MGTHLLMPLRTGSHSTLYDSSAADTPLALASPPTDGLHAAEKTLPETPTGPQHVGASLFKFTLPAYRDLADKSVPSAHAEKNKRINSALQKARGFATNPGQQEAQTALARELNDVRTARLLKDDKEFSANLLQITAGNLHQVVDDYVFLRPRNELGSALNLIARSKFGKTSDGQKILLKAIALERTGHIKIQNAGEAVRGMWNSVDVTVDDEFKGQPAGVALELVHELTHAVDGDDYPGKVYSIDEEVRTNRNQLGFYKELHQFAGFNDVEMERRLHHPEGGSLRSDIRSRYPTLPEHRYAL